MATSTECFRMVLEYVPQWDEPWLVKDLNDQSFSLHATLDLALEAMRGEALYQTDGDG